MRVLAFDAVKLGFVIWLFLYAVQRFAECCIVVGDFRWPAI